MILENIPFACILWIYGIVCWIMLLIWIILTNSKHVYMSFGRTKKFYSIINQNYLELKTDHRSRFRDMDIEVPNAW